MWVNNFNSSGADIVGYNSIGLSAFYLNWISGECLLTCVKHFHFFLFASLLRPLTRDPQNPQLRAWKACLPLTAVMPHCNAIYICITNTSTWVYFYTFLLGTWENFVATKYGWSLLVVRSTWGFELKCEISVEASSKGKLHFYTYNFARGFIL